MLIVAWPGYSSRRIVVFRPGPLHLVRFSEQHTTADGIRGGAVRLAELRSDALRTVFWLERRTGEALLQNSNPRLQCGKLNEYRFLAACGFLGGSIDPFEIVLFQNADKSTPGGGVHRSNKELTLLHL